MAKPSDKITITMTRSEWNKFLASVTSHEIEKRNEASIKFESAHGLS